MSETLKRGDHVYIECAPNGYQIVMSRAYAPAVLFEVDICNCRFSSAREIAKIRHERDEYELTYSEKYNAWQVTNIYQSALDISDLLGYILKPIKCVHKESGQIIRGKLITVDTEHCFGVIESARIVLDNGVSIVVGEDDDWHAWKFYEGEEA